MFLGRRLTEIAPLMIATSQTRIYQRRTRKKK